MKEFDLAEFNETEDKIAYCENMKISYSYWWAISIVGKLSEEFIRKFSDKVDWRAITTYQTLSEDFIIEFSDKISWFRVGNYQKLSENFIRENSHKLSWYDISIYQILSDEFIEEFSDRIRFPRPNIIFNRDIVPFDPCEDGVDRYLSNWTADQEITWNELLEKHNNISDITWLAILFRARGYCECQKK